jgi:hypothetical protein|tara:strand:- start:143 stop:2047 length:1905 start_codon:yes stop_codon:yes gene_type:complete
MATMWDIQYIEERTPEEIESQRLERVRKIYAFVNAGGDYNDRGRIHDAQINESRYIYDVPNVWNEHPTSSDLMWYKQDFRTMIHIDYFIRAAKKLGITVEQAKEVSRVGRESQSGKARDMALRTILDKNHGTSLQEKYVANRKLAALVTARSYANMSPEETAYYDKMPNVIPFAREQAKSVDPTFTALDPPQAVTITVNQITKNSASVNWSPNNEGGSGITGYHYVLVNNSTGQTMQESDFSLNQRNSFETNLIQGNSYTAFIIAKSQYGNSLESSKSFRTLGMNVIEEERRLSEEARVQRELDRELQAIQQEKIIKESASLGFNLDGSVFPIQEPEKFIGAPQPEIIPEGFHTMPDGSIMADSDMDKPFTIEFNQPAFAQEIEENYSVNVYNIKDNGDVYATTYSNISGSKLEELSKSFFVLSLDTDRLPTNKEVQDFYNFNPETSILGFEKTSDTKIDSTMVSQSVGAFVLKDGRVNGEILYIANQSFNPFYYGKNLTSLVQIKSKLGVVIAIKTNNLNFTQTERDERITIQESAGNFKELLIDFFVWDSPTSQLIFSESKQIQIVDESDIEPADPFDPKPPTTCQAGYHKDFSGKCVPDNPVGEIPRDKLIDTLKGFLFGTVALSLLARKY